MRFQGYAIIIGAMKSGTTTLHSILAQHPEIVSGKRKELDYFKRRAKPSVSEYEALFPRLDKYQHAFTLDSSPNYTKVGRWPAVPSRISALPGLKRLVYVLRNPLDRIESHIAHGVQRGRWLAGNWPLKDMLDISCYARQLRCFESAGLLDDVLLLDFDGLCADPTGTAYRVHDFLGVQRIAPRSVTAKNVRTLRDALLPRPDLEQFRDSLKADVEELITRYRFEPARAWDIC